MTPIRNYGFAADSYEFFDLQFQSFPAIIHHDGRNMEHGSHFVGNQSRQHILSPHRRNQHHSRRPHFHSIRLQTENQATHSKMVSEQST